MRSVIATLYAAASVCLFAADTNAQLTLRDGVRVRVTAPGSPEISGVVQSMTADSIFVFAEHGGKIGFSRASVTRLQVSDGRSASKGALKGVLWGGAIGLLTSGLLYIETKNAPDFAAKYGDGSSRGAYFAQGVLGSIFLGAGIGAFVKSENWQSVSLTPTVAADRAGVSVAFSFR